LVLDASAIVAVLLAEPLRESLLERVEAASTVAVGTPTLVEAALVLGSRLGEDPRPLLAGFLRRVDAEIVPFRQEHWEAAVEAFRRYGKGRHPAGLNFGDCLSYAVAKVAGMPLLFTGDDFSHTDVLKA
jgi:ribonuclease VapC